MAPVGATAQRALRKRAAAIFKGKNAAAIPIRAIPNSGDALRTPRKERLEAEKADQQSAVLKHGEQIFVYRHLLTNQVIYSLTRSLRNEAARSQIPFLGKNSVPAALRKDHWHPLCVLSFPSPPQGLSAFNKLREFRRLHELAYDPSIVTDKEAGGHKLLPKKKKTVILMDQKANSVADMAAVLLMQERPVEKAVVVPKDGRPPRIRAPRGEELWRGSVSGVQIRWSNVLDAEFAETWPKEVVHRELQVSRHTAVWPPVSAAEEVVEEVEEVKEEEEGVKADAPESVSNQVVTERPETDLEKAERSAKVV